METSAISYKSIPIIIITTLALILSGPTACLAHFIAGQAFPIFIIPIISVRTYWNAFPSECIISLIAKCALQRSLAFTNLAGIVTSSALLGREVIEEERRTFYCAERLI